MIPLDLWLTDAWHEPVISTSPFAFQIFSLSTCLYHPSFLIKGILRFLLCFVFLIRIDWCFIDLSSFWKGENCGGKFSFVVCIQEQPFTFHFFLSFYLVDQNRIAIIRHFNEYAEKWMSTGYFLSQNIQQSLQFYNLSSCQNALQMSVVRHFQRI